MKLTVKQLKELIKEVLEEGPPPMPPPEAFAKRTPKTPAPTGTEVFLKQQETIEKTRAELKAKAAAAGMSL